MTSCRALGGIAVIASNALIVKIEKDLQELHGISPSAARIGINFGFHVYFSFQWHQRAQCGGVAE